MSITWQEVSERGDFKSLSAAEQAQAREQYWREVVEPQVPAEQRTEARRQFDADTYIRKQDLPPGVVPSEAGAGRGIGPGARAPAPAGQPRRGSMRAVQPFGAGDARVQPPAPAAPPPPVEAGQGGLSPEWGGFDQPAPAPAPGSSVLDQPFREVDSFADASRQARAVSDRAAEVRSQPRPQQVGPATPAQSLALDVASATSNPVARGAVAGVSGLGKISTGAVRLLADLTGNEGAERFARGAAGAGTVLGQGAMEGLAGNTKLVADVTNSILNSAPSLALGLAGGPALRGLFVQSTLQEYNDGRDAGFDTGESLARAGIMGWAEAIGERYGGFAEQLTLLRAAANGLPQGELAKAVGNLLVKEIPGEQLTTAIQVLADKIGPAALAPDATIADYLNAAGETLKVTVGQMAVMGGGPAAIVTARNSLRRSEAARGDNWTPDPVETAVAASPYGAARAAGFVVDPPLATDPPQAQRRKTDEVFSGVAAMYGIPARFVDAARKAADGRPLRDLGAFYARFVQALQRRGAAPADIAPEAIEALAHGAVAPAAPEQAAPIDGAEAIQADDLVQPDDVMASIEATLRAAGALPEVPATAPDGTPGLPGQPDAAATPTLNRQDEIEAAASAAATSPLNDLPEPTDAQKEAGNYAKGHVRISGLDVSIENPRGSIRRSKADAAEPWAVEMPAHYGYLRGTKGADGDHVDLFIGSQGDNGRFWVINQTAPDGGRFDEHKVITGVESEAEAVEIYKASFADGFGDRVFDSITEELSADELRELLPAMARPRPIGSRESRRVEREDRTKVEALIAKADDEQVAAVSAALGIEAKSTKSRKALLIEQAQDDPKSVLQAIESDAKNRRASAVRATLQAKVVAIRKQRAVMRSLLECMAS